MVPAESGREEDSDDPSDVSDLALSNRYSLLPKMIAYCGLLFLTRKGSPMNWILIQGQDLHNTTIARRIALQLNAEKVKFESDYYGVLKVFVDEKLAYETNSVKPFTWRVPVHALADELLRGAN